MNCPLLLRATRGPRRAGSAPAPHRELRRAPRLTAGLRIALPQLQPLVLPQDSHT
jgi:hypothetical protein